MTASSTPSRLQFDSLTHNAETITQPTARSPHSASNAPPPQSQPVATDSPPNRDDPTDQTAPRDPLYALIGDSITSLEQPIYEQQLARCGTWLIDARLGRRTVGEDSGLAAVERLAQHEPDHWIVNLGTNDASETGRLDIDTAKWRIQQILSAIGENPSTWVTVVSPEHPTDAATWNHALEQLDVPTVDWAQQTDPSLRWDGVHVTKAGATALANSYCTATRSNRS